MAVRKEISRSKLAIRNLAGTIGQKLISIVIGLFVPKLLLETFGSTVNGTVSSAVSFLGIIALLQGGFDSVAKTAFYKPLANKDWHEVSRVYKAADSYFKRIALLYGAYVVVLAIIFPFINHNGFEYFFNFSLVLILGVDSFASEYFGITYSVLFNADQRSAISSLINIFIVILNAIIVVICIKVGFGIHMVKIASTIVFLLRPAIINYVGRKNYPLDKKVAPNLSVLSEKWNNVGVTIAGFVHSKVDYVLMTILLDFKQISVYCVYQLVTSNLSVVLGALSTGFVPGLGHMYAKGEKQAFERNFKLYEFINFFMVSFLFTTAGIMIVPFVSIYTRKVTDINYIRPVFGYIMVLAEALYALRLPYNYAVVNARHFLQMRRPAIIEVIINFVISIALIIPLGITGLAVGTLVGSLYRTVYTAWYCSKFVTRFSFLRFIRNCIIFAITSIISILCSTVILIPNNSFGQWCCRAIVVSLIVFIIQLSASLIFFRQECNNAASNIKTIIKR